MPTHPESRALSAGTTLESLKKQAKRWLKALHAGDAEQRARLERVLPGAPAAPTLRDVQHALACELGLAGWVELKERLADLALARRSAAERAEDFLRAAVDRHNIALAAHILRKHPDIARSSLHAAVVAGALGEVERRLAASPSDASALSGPKQWQPLLRSG